MECLLKLKTWFASTFILTVKGEMIPSRGYLLAYKGAELVMVI